MRVRCRRPRGPYFEEDFFEELLDDLRAEDFDDFFDPLLRDALDFLAPDLEPERDLDEDFLLVAGDLAIADVLSFPFSKGTGIASPAVMKKPPSGLFSLITRKPPLSLSTTFFDARVSTC